MGTRREDIDMTEVSVYERRERGGRRMGVRGGRGRFSIPLEVEAGTGGREGDEVRGGVGGRTFV